VLDDFKNTKMELDAIRKALQEAMSSMGGLEKDNRKLSEKVTTPLFLILT
jgi:hypothetical protein